MKGFKGNVVTTGMLYDFYRKVAAAFGMDPVSDRWFRQYMSDLETYGIVSIRQATGRRGNVRVVDLLIDPRKTLDVIERSFK